MTTIITKERSFTKDDLKYQLARVDFRTWLGYVKIQQQLGVGENTPTAIPYEMWPFLDAIIEAYLTERLIEWLKARQVSASWLTALFLLWFTSYHTNVHVGEFSKNEEEAKELIRKQKFAYGTLPPQLQVPLKSRDNQLEIVFRDTDSWIRAFPSTEDAGRGHTFSKVWLDEFDYHLYGESCYYSVKPALDDVGGQLIITSTPDHETMDSQFKTLILGAPDNGFHKIYVPWSARPDRDEAWYQARKSEYSDPYRFSKEFSSTEEEALAPPRTMTFFDHDILREMETLCRPPVEHTGSTNIYQKFSPGRRYVAASDLSHGIGMDNSVTVVMDVDAGVVVADIMSPYLSNDDFLMETIDLLGKFDNPLWGPEDNDAGVYIIRKARELGYNNIYQARIKGGRGTRLTEGFHTGGGTSGTRSDLWAELQSATHSRALTLYNKDGLDQFYQIIRNPQKYGRAEARSGGHDDYPMAVGICLMIRHQARRASRIRSKLNEAKLMPPEEYRGRRRKGVKPW